MEVQNFLYLCQLQKHKRLLPRGFAVLRYSSSAGIGLDLNILSFSYATSKHKTVSMVRHGKFQMLDRP